MSEDMKRKLTSRKFWLAVAAFLASVGTGLGGVFTDQPAVAAVGGVCCVLSCGIYAACEAYVDGKSLSSDQSTTVFNVSGHASQDTVGLLFDEGGGHEQE